MRPEIDIGPYVATNLVSLDQKNNLGALVVTVWPRMFGFFVRMFVTSRACLACSATSLSSLPRYGHHRKDPRSILVRHVRHARFSRNLLATSDVTRMSRGCYEENYSWNLSLTAVVAGRNILKQTDIAVCCLLQSWRLTRPYIRCSTCYYKLATFLTQCVLSSSICILVHLLPSPQTSLWRSQKQTTSVSTNNCI